MTLIKHRNGKIKKEKKGLKLNPDGVIRKRLPLFLEKGQFCSELSTYTA
jgi:hypothetical protein